MIPLTRNYSHLKIIDFGLGVQSNTFDSRLMEADCGTVIYMSPERLAKARCSQKADVYSVGIILLELLQGPLAKTLHFKEKHQLRLFLQDNTWDLSNSGCSK
jgi:serine/threonine protein kinase